MTNNHPTPDPAWDYAQLWKQTEQFGTQLLDLNAYLVTVENTTPETDRKVRELLENFKASIEGAIALLPPQH